MTRLEGLFIGLAAQNANPKTDEELLQRIADLFGAWGVLDGEEILAKAFNSAATRQRAAHADDDDVNEEPEGSHRFLHTATMMMRISKGTALLFYVAIFE